MRDLAIKVDDVGDTLSATDFNAQNSESENIVTSADIPLDPPGGPDVDLSMLGKSVSGYANAGSTYQDSGIANSYVLSITSNLESPSKYYDNMTVTFKAGNSNNGSSTININSLGIKDITTSLGVVLTANDIVLNNYYTLVYNLSDDRFELISEIPNLFNTFTTIETFTPLSALTNNVIVNVTANLSNITEGNIQIVLDDDITKKIQMEQGETQVFKVTDNLKISSIGKFPNELFLSSFSAPDISPTGLTFANGNLISCDNISNTIYIHDGISNTILSFFTAPSTNLQGLTFANGNLISCETSIIRIHDGVSNTILSSFAAPDVQPMGLTFANGNLISCDGSTDEIFIHDGVSNTILSSFASPNNNTTGLTFANGNLISCEITTNTIYIHDGISNTILSSFNISGELSGLTFANGNLISSDSDSNTIHIHDNLIIFNGSALVSVILV